MDLATCQALGFRQDGIIDLTRLGLSPEAIVARRKWIGGSDANVIGDGTDDDRNKLARTKRGLEDGDDLSDIMYVQLGNITEPFILAWAEKIHGFRISRRGERVFHRRHGFLAATLDGWVQEYIDRKGVVGTRVVQCKHVNGWTKPEQVRDDYRWQIQHEIAVTGAQGCLLVMMIGTSEFDAFDIAPDFVMWDHILTAERAFWAAVREGRDPSPPPRRSALPPAPPLKKSQRLGEASLEGSNAWADAAARFLEAEPFVERLENAKADLKALVPAGIKRAFGHGVNVTAASNGAVTIRPMTAAKIEKEAA